MKEVAFKSIKKFVDVPKAITYQDDEEENIVGIMKKGSRNYKGSFTFKKFYYGRIGHYTTRFPFKEDNNKRPGDDKRKDSYRKNERNKMVHNIDKSKKNFCSMETHSYKYEDVNDSKDEKLFLALKKNGSKRFDSQDTTKNNKKSIIVRISLHKKNLNLE